MAVADRSLGPSDARVPCPLCGGLIHPIAGRCKHCKADVAAQRTTRPAASGALPPLARTSHAPGVDARPGSPGASASYAPHVAATPDPELGPSRDLVPAAAPQLATSYLTTKITEPVIAAEGRPILPPRPTGRMQAAPVRSPVRSFTRHWPVVVILLAVLAIALAVVLMLWPPAGNAKAETRRRGTSPAPERMDTHPVLPPPHTDPWNGQGRNAPIPPRPPAAPPAPAPDPDDTYIDPNDPLQDPFGNPGGGLGGIPFGKLSGGAMFGRAIIKHACDRIRGCPTSDATTMCTMMDQAFGQSPSPPLPTCAAAQRCIAQIDRLDLCGGSSSGSAMTDVMTLLATAQDCLEAANC